MVGIDNDDDDDDGGCNNGYFDISKKIMYSIVAEKYQIPILCDEVYAYVVSLTFFSS
jgi:hypothetical protein